MPTRLFISYRSLDSARVDTLIARLHSLRTIDGSPRYKIWQDKTSILSGQDWWKAILQGIVDCEVFVFMTSQMSVQSPNCRAELSYARKRNRPIIPLVLDGEFTYNPTTGKNDIAFWQSVPVQLTDNRFQFLFYEGTAWLEQFNQAVDQLTALRLRDIPAPEPPDPRISDEASNDTTTIYDQACDYAWRLEFASAERLFQRLIDWRDSLFSDDAHEWIQLLREYEQMVRIDERTSARYKIPLLWQNYSKNFPKPFTHLFDPKNFLFTYGKPTAPPEFETIREFRPNTISEDSAIFPTLEPFGPSSTGGESQRNFSSIFDNLFGSFSSSNPIGSLRDNEIQVTLSLEQAFHGTVVPINIKRLEICTVCGGKGGKSGRPRKITCPSCNGFGYSFSGVSNANNVSNRYGECSQCFGIGKIANPSCDNCRGAGVVLREMPLDIEIPPGIQNGSVIQIREEAGVDAKSKAKLDLYVRVTVKLHDYYRLSGSDLRTTQVVDDHLAFTGGSIDVDTIEGMIRMRIPNSTADHQVFRLHGKGMPRLNTDGTTAGRGDHLVELRLSSKIGPLLRHTLSVETLGDVATPLINRGTELPSENTQVFSTANDDQTTVEIHIYYGESTVASKNTSLGKFLLEGIPKAPKGVPQIKVTFSVDAARRLYVNARDVGTGYYQSLSPIELDKYE